MERFCAKLGLDIACTGSTIGQKVQQISTIPVFYTSGTNVYCFSDTILLYQFNSIIKHPLMLFLHFVSINMIPTVFLVYPSQLILRHYILNVGPSQKISDYRQASVKRYTVFRTSVSSNESRVLSSFQLRCMACPINP